MKALLIGALIGLLLAYPQLRTTAVAVTTWAAAHPAPTACMFALLTGARPAARGWSR